MVLYEDKNIILKLTGRDYDFIATIENKLDKPIQIEFKNAGIIGMSANNWVGLLADDDGRTTVNDIITRQFSVKVLYNDESLEEMWRELEDVPIDQNECLDIDWKGWCKGTHREEIWHWFDEWHSKGVGWLMNEYEG